jgi:DNA-binding response OmpR family regulator
MRLKEAQEITGLSQQTLKTYIHQGKLDAKLVGSGQHKHWEINPESLESVEKKRPKDDDNSQQTDTQLLINTQQRQIQVLEQELERRAREIQELHVLLQQAQAAIPAPKESRSWWRFWSK